MNQVMHPASKNGSPYWVHSWKFWRIWGLCLSNTKKAKGPLPKSHANDTTSALLGANKVRRREKRDIFGDILESIVRQGKDENGRNEEREVVAEVIEQGREVEFVRSSEEWIAQILGALGTIWAMHAEHTEGKSGL